MTDSDWIKPVCEAYRAGRHLALCFDYDGTLTPIVSHPRLAVLSASTRNALDTLARLERVTLGIVSGRSLQDLRNCVALPTVWYAGSGGMHLRMPGLELVDPTIANFEAISERIEAAVAALLRWFPGTWIERKEGCLSLHFRTLERLRGACFLSLARDAIQSSPIGPQLRCREVTKSLEVTLAGAWTKGDAVATFCRSLPDSTMVMYAGDAANDLEAIDHVNSIGGLTIAIGPDAPHQALHRVENVADFLESMHRLPGHLSKSLFPHGEPSRITR